jgi:hypothetical protein
MSLLLFEVAQRLDVVGSGGITLAGSAVVSRSSSLTASGGITFAGTAPVSFTQGHGGGKPTLKFSMTGSGGLIFAGSAAVSHLLIFTPTGGLTFAGSAPFDVSLPPPPVEYVNVGSGGFIFAGAAEILNDISEQISGELSFGGAASVLFIQAPYQPDVPVVPATFNDFSFIRPGAIRSRSAAPAIKIRGPL